MQVHAPIAHVEERSASNGEVRGSSPLGGTMPD